MNYPAIPICLLVLLLLVSLVSPASPVSADSKDFPALSAFPPAPPRPQLEAGDADGVIVRWKGVAGPVTGYILQAQRGGGEWERVGRVRRHGPDVEEAGRSNILNTEQT